MSCQLIRKLCDDFRFKIVVCRIELHGNTLVNDKWIDAAMLLELIPLETISFVRNERPAQIKRRLDKRPHFRLRKITLLIIRNNSRLISLFSKCRIQSLHGKVPNACLMGNRQNPPPDLARTDAAL